MEQEVAMLPLLLYLRLQRNCIGATLRSGAPLRGPDSSACCSARPPYVRVMCL